MSNFVSLITEITLVVSSIAIGWCIWMHMDDDVLKMGMLHVAADYGDTEACRDLGRLYFEGDAIRINHLRAERYLRRAAEEGDADAQFILGMMYLNGTMVRVDLPMAYKLFRMSSSSGNANALFQLGMMYLNGTYVRRSEMYAYQCFRRCSEMGMEEADRMISSFSSLSRPSTPGCIPR